MTPRNPRTNPEPEPTVSPISASGGIRTRWLLGPLWRRRSARRAKMFSTVALRAAAAAGGPLLLNGRAASAALLDKMKAKVAALDPQLTVVQVGNDPASKSYVRQKIKSCDAVGMRHNHMHLDDDVSLSQLLGVVGDLNANDDVTGFFVQLPLPPHLEPHIPEIIEAISPVKDVDGFCAHNLGNMFQGAETLPPATPSGIMHLLDHYEIDVKGKHAVVVGHSNTVGKPASVMLLNREATVTTCHKETKDLASLTSLADILVVAVGIPGLIKEDMVKPGAVIVDVGISRTPEGLRGDVDPAVYDKTAAYSPVPGGAGPMTVCSLIANCVAAKEMQEAQRKQ